MHHYYIEHKIKTLADCWDPFNYKGFHFQHWDFTVQDACKGQAWIVCKEVEAENVIEAINGFRNELRPIIARIGYIAQCYTTMEWQSWLIMRIDDNPEKNFLCFYSREDKPVGLHFDKEEIESLKKLEDIDDKVFFYLNESNLVGTHLSNTAMLIIALEGLAGEEIIKKECTDCHKKLDEWKGLNKDKAKEIIGEDDVYKEIFGHGDGIRNLLFHGKVFDPISRIPHKNINVILLRKINKYFNSTFGTKIDPMENIVHPQRHILGNFSGGYRWLSMQDKNEEISLKNVIEDFDEDGNVLMKVCFHISAPKEFIDSY